MAKLLTAQSLDKKYSNLKDQICTTIAKTVEGRIIFLDDYEFFEYEEVRDYFNQPKRLVISNGDFLADNSNYGTVWDLCDFGFPLISLIQLLEELETHE